MREKTQQFLFAIFVTMCCLVSGCGGSSSSSTNTTSPQTQPKTSDFSSTPQSVEQSQQKTSSSSEQPKQDMAKEEQALDLNGKPVTDEMLQAFKENVTEEEMQVFLNVARSEQYTESQVRDIAARMKMVGIDFSLLKRGQMNAAFDSDFDFPIKNAYDYQSDCFLNNCGVYIKTKKEDKTQVESISLHKRQQGGGTIRFYTLYKRERIVGDFSDVLISSDGWEQINSTIDGYIASRRGNRIDKGFFSKDCAALIISKDALSDESKWKGGDAEKFSFPIIYCRVLYNEPSEVYGQKEQEQMGNFFFNNKGELLVAYNSPDPKNLGELLMQAAEKVKL